MGKVTDYIPEGYKNAITREDLRLLTGLNDRELRDQINKSNELVINMNDGRGYFKPLPKDYHLVMIWERTFWRRIRNEMERVNQGTKWRVDIQKECDIYCPCEEDASDI